MVHDLLAHLAQQMSDIHKQRQRIETALDPFKFLNRGVDFVKLTDAFPGGYTRTALKKLQLTRVPAYDPDADLTPLVELSEELAGVRDRIAGTDYLIDQIVYRLYGLTEEEIAVVEGKDGG